jgi:dTDP-4-amino-4,6-dideoxygalactose transaminase
MNARSFGTKNVSNQMATRKASTMSAVPQRDVNMQMTGNLKDMKVREAPLRPPKEYMFARTDFSVEKAKLEEVLDSGVLFRYHEPNPEDIPAAKLEQAFCEKFGFKYALGVNSASSGLLLSLLASGVEPGDSVLMPAFTFVAVPSSIVLAGANPVLVEINNDYALDPDHMLKQIEKYNPKWLMLSYMRGAIPDLDRILDICSKHNITLIEDTAHAMGVKWKGQQVGTFGESTVTSFQSHKIMDAGEGGMLGTNDIDVFLKAAFLSGCYEMNIKRHIIDHPEKEKVIQKYLNKIPPYNLRMSNMTAALLFNQFEILEEKAQYHRDIY